MPMPTSMMLVPNLWTIGANRSGEFKLRSDPSNFVSINRRRAIAPRVANIGRDIRDLLIAEFPREAGHRLEAGSRTCRSGTRAAEDQTDHSTRIVLLDNGASLQGREHAGLSFALGQMTGGAGVKEDCRSGSHRRPIRGGARECGACRKRLEIGCDCRQIGI